MGNFQNATGGSLTEGENPGLLLLRRWSSTSSKLAMDLSGIFFDSLTVKMDQIAFCKYKEHESSVIAAKIYPFTDTINKGVELDCHSVEFDDVRYHIQVSMRSPEFILLSMSLPTPPPETVFFGGLPSGALDAIKEAYGVLAQILDPPKDGYNLTMKLNLAKLPQDEEEEYDLLVKIASLREVVLGAPLRVVLKHLASKKVAADVDQLVAIVHRQKESFFLVSEADKVTVVFPMRFKDSTDVVLATSFLQEFVEARRTAGLNTAPPCLWSPSPPLELKGAPSHALTANAGFVTFVIFPRHVEGRKLDKTVWSLLTFHAYVSYHVKMVAKLGYPLDLPSTIYNYELFEFRQNLYGDYKNARCSEGFMHTRMRRRVESLIQALDRAKPDIEKSKKTSHNRSFKRLSLKEARSSSNS
ncbi:hypothetical protein GIB67_035297 [Kingdonia uniflora]|uniref:Arp2/3 complex 34 kDa subunit n=1 Tax=Kingdonia uniflora TaxID=39325 RepID=A0A7J7KXY9_9MAGN|nr:hypothetical protein GIB67_035297 [Kingdonia uniflora]